MPPAASVAAFVRTLLGETRAADEVRLG